MDTSTFFEKFELIAEAPDAVAKMRELVLKLACTGKFGTSDPSDKSANDLLAKISDAKNALAETGTFRPKPSRNTENAGDEFEIPDNWIRVKIEDLCYLLTGATPSRSNPSFFDGDIKWLVSGDINKAEIVDCEGRISQAGLDSSNCKPIPENSILIALNGQGKTRATVALLRTEATCNQSLVAIVPFDQKLVIPEYIFWNLRGRYRAIRDITGQNQRRGLNMGLVNALSIPLPPLAEQKRIVAKVDELMALCDQLEAQQQKRETQKQKLNRAALARFTAAPTVSNLELLFYPTTPSSPTLQPSTISPSPLTPHPSSFLLHPSSFILHPSDFRKTILTLAVQGKLVPQDPNDEPYPNLSVEKDDRFNLPDNWKWMKLGEVYKSSFYGPRFGKNEYVSSGGYPTIRTTDMTSKGEIELKDAPNVLIEDPKKLKLYELKANDLLVTRSGSIGVMAIFRGGYKAIPSAYLIRFRFPDTAYTDYFYHYLSSPYGQAQLGLSQRAVGVPNVNATSISKFIVPVPPLAEQRRIVAKVDQLMALVDKLEAQLEQSRSTATNLLTALVAELTAKPRPANETASSVVDLQTSPEFKRAALAAEIVGRMRANPTFGQIKFTKVIYLAENIAQLSEIDSRPERAAAGPYDPRLIEAVESKMRELNWYQDVPRKTVGKFYEPLADVGQHQGLLAKLWPQTARIIEKLIHQMQTWKTERCERFATLYAAWNDLLIWGHEATDEAILDQVLNHWHPSKQAIPVESWKESLTWMREHHYTPTGYGHPTMPAPQPNLF